MEWPGTNGNTARSSLARRSNQSWNFGVESGQAWGYARQVDGGLDIQLSLHRFQRFDQVRLFVIAEIATATARLFQSILFRPCN